MTITLSDAAGLIAAAAFCLTAYVLLRRRTVHPAALAAGLIALSVYLLLIILEI